MKLWLSIILALLVSGCAALRRDAIVAGIFPEDVGDYADGIDIPEEWAQ